MPSINLNHEYPEINQADANALAIGALNGVLKSDGANGFSVVPVDAAPTASSTNLVESGGVKAAIDAAVQTAVPKRTAQNDPANSSFSVLCDTAIAGEAKPKLYGKSVAINQLVQNGNFADASGWSGSNGTVSVSSNALTYTATSASSWYNNRVNSPSVTLVQGHRYYVAAYCKAASATQFYLSSYSVSAASSPFADTSLGTLTANTSTATGAIVDAAVSCQDGELRFSLRNGMAVNDTFELRNVVCIDLTAIFTAAELTAIGTSVANLKAAWLAKFGYPLPQYIDYDAGSIVSNNATYQMHGRNLWDEEWELGGYDADTGAPTTLNQVRSKATDPIKVSPSTEYCFYNASARISNVYWYDANDQYIGRTQNASANPFVTTSPDNAAFVRFGCPSGYGTTYKSDICVNISDASFSGTYEPYYNGGSVTADNLNGIGTAVDSQDAEGQIVRRIGGVDLGTLTWSYGSGYFTGFTLSQTALAAPLGICPKYTVVQSAVANLNDKECRVNGGAVYIKDTAYSDAAAFKTAMNGVMLYYELATPTTDTTTPSDLSTQAGYNSLGPVSGDVQSADASVEYPVDVIAYIDKKLAEL